MTSGRSTLPRQRQTFKQEIVIGKTGRTSATREAGLLAAIKLAESIPDLIEVTKMVVAIKGIEAEADAMVQVLREQTYAFVSAEWERRQTVETRGQIMTDLLQKLHDMLRVPGITEDVQKMLIENCNLAMRAVLQTDGS